MTMSRSPRISVVLPAYNAEKYIDESIRSVLTQVYADFELIIVDDGSCDATSEKIAKYTDERIVYIRQPNLGLSRSLNRAIYLARGEYIARQDADDISVNTRLIKQLDFLSANPSCGIVGSWSRIMVESALTLRSHSHPASNGELQFKTFFDSFFVHSSVMFRRDAFFEAGMYSTSPERNPPEDLDLWQKIANLNYRLANIPEKLIIYREIPTSIARSRANILEDNARKICASRISSLLLLNEDSLIHSNPPNSHDIANLVLTMRDAKSFEKPFRAKRMIAVVNLIRNHLLSIWGDDARCINSAAKSAISKIKENQELIKRL